MSSALISNLKRRHTASTYENTKNVIDLLNEVIIHQPWKNATELLMTIKKVGNKLKTADPMAFYINNIVKRVLHIIRVEARKLKIVIEEDSNNPLRKLGK